MLQHWLLPQLEDQEPPDFMLQQDGICSVERGGFPSKENTLVVWPSRTPEDSAALSKCQDLLTRDNALMLKQQPRKTLVWCLDSEQQNALHQALRLPRMDQIDFPGREISAGFLSLEYPSQR
ncbi:hypothetical protein J437_LFUL005270 [Ladona fulva]|uniref:Uncharacterized protein n=1 Tax=Ladona fulva TaxID=123851 RepID=A0A8K0P8Q4_LADFU|nr:hypothetical protein J437_LFUL005270 [Ladona fulva]